MAAICSTPVPLTAAGYPLTAHRSVNNFSVGVCRSSGCLPSFTRLAASFTAGMPRRTVCDGTRASASSSSSSGTVATDARLTSLEGIKVYDPNGAVVSLVGLWESRPAVVAFARHFGCILCRKRAELLQSRKAEMDTAGVALILIAPGSPGQAKQFVEQTKFSGEVYGDPDQASYAALNFAKGAGSILNPKSGSRLVKAFIEGYRQDWELSLDKDTVQRGGWQQGGILVAGPGVNNVRYLFKDAEAGDEPELEDVMNACCPT